MSPGFTFDEPLAQLGRSLRLPPWEEAHRAEIEAALPAVTTVVIAKSENAFQRPA
jgi:glyoxalase family protein